MRLRAARFELDTIRPIASRDRHGSAADLFTVWFGSNMMLLTVITGGLAVTAFKLPLVAAIAGLVIGNLVGAVFMALHAAQGPTLGVPQMVQTRGQFGSYGSFLVITIVVVMYVGFLASNLVLCGESLATFWPAAGDTAGIWAIGALSLVAAIYGHDLIHAYARLMSYVAGAALLLAFAWILWVHGLPADLGQRNAFSWNGFLGTISAAALWQIAYAPYVSDYSRYLPAQTGVRPAFWASYSGCALGSLLPMILGVLVGLAPHSGSLVASLAALTQPIAPLVLAVFCVSIAGANAMNLYCGALSSLTLGQTLLPAWQPGAWSRTWICVLLLAVAIGVALLSQDSFLANYESFILILLYVLVPWTAINLVDYYLLRHGVYDVAAFFRRDGGIYGRINTAAVSCYALGIAVQLPFIASPLYTGPAARALGGADLSWIVGLLITSPVYYVLARWSRSRGPAPVGQYAPGEL